MLCCPFCQRVDVTTESREYMRKNCANEDAVASTKLHARDVPVTLLTIPCKAQMKMLQTADCCLTDMVTGMQIMGP